MAVDDNWTGHCNECCRAEKKKARYPQVVGQEQHRADMKQTASLSAQRRERVA